MQNIIYKKDRQKDIPIECRELYAILFKNLNGEKNLKKKKSPDIHICTYKSITLLYTWNQYNIVNQLYFKIKLNLNN